MLSMSRSTNGFFNRRRGTKSEYFEMTASCSAVSKNATNPYHLVLILIVQSALLQVMQDIRRCIDQNGSSTSISLPVTCLRRSSTRVIAIQFQLYFGD